jgi:hypothetical protein
MMVKKEEKKMTVKQWVLIGLGVLAGAIVLMSISIGIWSLLTFSVWQSEKDGVSIFYPKGWSVNPHAVDTHIVGFVAPKDNALDTFQENFQISTYAMTKDVHSIDKYARIMIDQLVMVFTDLKVQEKGIFFISGHKGRRIVLNSKEGVLTIVVYAITQGDTGYNLLYMGKEDRYPWDRHMIDAMAFSFKVKH